MQAEIAPLPYKTVELPDRSVGIAVRYLNEEQTFSALQVTSMLFTKLKLTAEQALGIKVNDVVIGVSKNKNIYKDIYICNTMHPLKKCVIYPYCASVNQCNMFMVTMLKNFVLCIFL